MRTAGGARSTFSYATSIVVDEMSRMAAVQGLSRWGIEQALATRPGSGLTPGGDHIRQGRSGWQLFGLDDSGS